MKKNEAMSSARSYRKTQVRQGTYALGLTAIVLVLLVVVNLLVRALPDEKTNIDLSPSLLYTISDTSRQLAAGLTEDVTLTVVQDPDDADERIQTFLESYASLSSHFTLDSMDPALHPEIISEYGIEDSCVLVRCAATGRHKTVNFSDIVVKQPNAYYQYYYNQTVMEERWFDGEGQLSSAVNYVTGTDLSAMYITYMHGEVNPSDQVNGLLSKANIETKALDINEEGIPEDCDVMLISEPVSDLSADEADQIIAWLQKGHKLIVTTGSTPQNMFNPDNYPNLMKVLADYGLTMKKGIVIDNERNGGRSNPFLIFAVVDEETESFPSIDLSSSSIALNMASSIGYLEGTRRTVKYEELMHTSASAYFYYPEESTVTQDFNQETLAVKATDGDTQLILFGSGSIADASLSTNYTNLSNARAFMDLVESLYPDLTTVTIDSKDLRVSYNAVSHGLAWGLAFAAIPLVLIIVGFVIWFRRRRK